MNRLATSLVAIVLTLLLTSFINNATIQAKQKGPTEARPTLTPGDSWSYIYNGDSFELTFRGEEKGNLVFDTVYKNTFRGIRYQTGDLNYIKLVKAGVPDSPDGVIWANDPHSGQLDFPLSVGKSWRHNYVSSYPGRPNAHRTAYAKVMDYDDVTVAAGTFAAFKIERQNQKERCTVSGL